MTDPSDETRKTSTTNVHTDHQFPISRPRKLKTLRSSIHSQFTKQLSDVGIHTVVAELAKNGNVIAEIEKNITRDLRKSSSSRGSGPI